LREKIESFADQLCARSIAAVGTMSQPRKAAGPIADSYWVRPNHLAAGEYPGSPDESKAGEKVQRLLRAGVTFLLDWTEEREPLISYEPLLQSEGTRLRSSERPSRRR
jgi:hypothetical protein